MPPITALLAFQHAARHQSFRKAADLLGLSPSAVSHQIRGLEARFGVRLFARSTRSVTLTPAGAQYLGEVQAALAMLAAAGQKLRARAGTSHAELRVSALPFFASTVILPHLAQLDDFCPGLTLRLQATHDYADFDSPDVDVAIRYGKRHAVGLRFEKLLEVQSLPVCASKLAGSLRCPADLSGMTLIHLTAQPGAWPAWLATSGLSDLKPKGELWVDTVPSALESAEHGLGVALAMHPLIALREGFGKSLLAPLAPSEASGAFYFVTRTEQSHDRKIVAFRAWLKQALVRVQSGK